MSQAASYSRLLPTLSVRRLADAPWRRLLHVLRPAPWKRAAFYLVADVSSLFLFARLLLPSTPGVGNWYALATIVVLVKLALGTVLSLYQLKWSTFSLSDVIRTTLPSLGAVAVLLGLKSAGYLPPASLPMLIVWVAIDLTCIIALRCAKRLARELPGRPFSFRPARGRRALLVVGAEKSYFLLDALRRLPGDELAPVGFLDPDPANRGMVSQGLPVLGTPLDVEKVVRRHRIQTVLVFLGSTGLGAGLSLDQFYARLHQLDNVAVRTIPSLTDLVGGRAFSGTLERLAIHQLSGRPPVPVPVHEMRRTFGGRCVLVTGAGGSIGSEICRQLARFGPGRLVLFERDDSNLFYIERELATAHPDLDVVPWLGDITRDPDVADVFRRYRPEVVFHAAAYKHVPILEFHPADAIRVNVLGAHALACAAVRHGTDCFIYISTDKAVNPSNVMGASKRIGEMVVTSMNGLGDSRFIAVRFGNVLDTRGSVSTIFREAIQRRQPLTITLPEMKRYFMLPEEAVLLVMQAASLGHGGEVFVLDMGNPIRIGDLALTMIRQAGLRPDIDIPIVVTGPRPGEKLFEELLTAEEGTIATANDRIYRARISRQHCYPDLLRELRTIEKLIGSADPSAIRAEIGRIVRSYTPDLRSDPARPTASRACAGESKPAIVGTLPPRLRPHNYGNPPAPATADLLPATCSL
jgi:FlaA1/EpsC-like NDP-sugar epimerase